MPEQTRTDVGLGVFFFAAVGDQAAETYRLVLDCARRGDELGFTFVSTPERHFHRFGGAFPNPAVTSAAIAAITERIQIRTGSLITPLHPTVRIVEDLAMLDCLSGGRIAVSVGSGWNVNDFVIAPAEYENRRARVVHDIAALREAWRTGRWSGVNPAGTPIDLSIHPRPVSAELELWTTASRSIDTFRQAGEMGTNVLTHLENQGIDELAEKIAVYRSARRSAGLETPGKVTVMLHTYVAPTTEEAHTVGGRWLRRYLATAIDLEASAVTAGGRMSGNKRGRDFLTADQAQARLVELAVNRYLDGTSLIGSVADCARVVDRLAAAGVDEAACLVDFVGDPAAVLAGLDQLAAVREVRAPATV
jgi:natural product biosynthesis luciferase-like monooxygenase protein